MISSRLLEAPRLSNEDNSSIDFSVLINRLHRGVWGLLWGFYELRLAELFLYLPDPFSSSVELLASPTLARRRQVMVANHVSPQKYYAVLT